MLEENETNSSNESSLTSSDLNQETNDSDPCSIKRKRIDADVSFDSNSFDDDTDSLFEENLTKNIITSYKYVYLFLEFETF